MSVLGPNQPPTGDVSGAFSGGGDVSHDNSHHLVSRLRKNGAITPLPLYEFVECIMDSFKICFLYQG